MNSATTPTQASTVSPESRPFTGWEGDQCADCGQYRLLDRLACVCEVCYDRGGYGCLELSEQDAPA